MKTPKYSIFLVLLTVMVFMYSIKTFGGVKIMQQDLKLELSLDKENYKENDSLSLDYCLTNVSNQPKTILKWGGAPYLHRKVVILDKNKTELHPEVTTFYEINPIIPKEDLESVEPQKKYCMNFVGHLVAGQSTNELSLEFPNSKYKLQRNQTYEIKGVYRVTPDISKDLKKYYGVVIEETNQGSSVIHFALA